MKKKLLLVTKRKTVQEMYLKEIDHVFHDYLEIIPAIHSEDNAQVPLDQLLQKADIILITNPYSFPQARDMMKEDAKIINLNFAFAKKKIEALKRYPSGTETLVCFNYYSSAHQAASALYEAGLRNLNLYIHYPGNKNIVGKTLELCLISGKTEEIPEDIPHVFDLGERKLALSTLLDIAIKADILDEELETRITDYCDQISVPDDHLSYFYTSSAESQMQLKTLTNCIDYSIILFDHNYKVIQCNQNFLDTFNITTSVTGTAMNDLPWFPGLTELILSDYQFKNVLFQTKKGTKRYLVSKEKVNKADKRYNVFIILMKDVTELMKLETTLRKQIASKGHVAKYHFSDIIGKSPVFKECTDKAKKIARIDKPTLIIGESGTGKELFAQSIHNESQRSRFPFIAMNCAAIPATLLESELFGYEEGSFTGASKGGKTGLFQMAHKGTLFLDEIGELSLPTQAKLLRVLEEKEIMKIGSGEIIDVDVRVIAATNRNLNALVNSGDFRLDLYYRLNTLILNIPPLRARSSDISLLMDSFLRSEGLGHVVFDSEVIQFFSQYNWKGNIRELRNCVEYMANIADGVVTMKHLPDYITEEYEALSSKNKRLLKDLSDFNTQEVRAIVNILSTVKEHSAGRRTILAALDAAGFNITEYRLRTILQYLGQNRYIFFGKGRTGSVITKQGEQLLDSLLDNMRMAE